jgi:hypothetical protein
MLVPRFIEKEPYLLFAFVPTDDCLGELQPAMRMSDKCKKINFMEFVFKIVAYLSTTCPAICGIDT